MVPPPSDPIIIKKYGNRRLYDTRRSQYITLEDLAGIVRSGSHVKVVDSATDRDLTRQVLTQVILELQDALDLVPVELLHAVIRVQGTLEQAPFAAFLATMTGQFISRGNLLAQQLASFMGGMPGFGGVDASRPAEPSTPGQASRRSSTRGAEAGSPEEASPEGGSGAPAPAPAPAPDPAPDADLANVRQRMDALLSKLQK